MIIETTFDLISRAVRHPNDYLSILKTYQLTLKERIQESENIFSFIFTTDTEIQWLAGQHGIFILPLSSTKHDRTRIFSVASSVTEKHIRITTVISEKPSVFKSALKSIKVGQIITMRGPIGEFHLTDKTKHIVGVAGGVGITPLRSIIKEVIDTKRTDIKIDLLYGTAPDAKTFEAELSEWSKSPNVSVVYPSSKEDLQIRLQTITHDLGDKAWYYLSGSPSMIEELQTLLKQQQIQNIINDPFKGYG